MRKKLLLTLVLGILLGGLLFYVIFFEKQKMVIEEAEKNLFSPFEKTEILSLTFKPLTSERFILSLTKEGWKVTEPMNYKADRVAVESLLDNLPSLAVLSVVEESTNDLDKYGLVNSALELKVKSVKGEQVINIGDMSFDGQNRYIKKGDDKKVYFIEDAKLEQLFKPVEQFMDRHIVDINANMLNSIKYNIGGEDVSLKLSKENNWSFTDSTKIVDKDKVANFITQITNFEADSFYDLNGSTSLSMDNLLYKVELGIGSASQSLLAVREEGSGENVILKLEPENRSKKDLLFKVSENSFKSLLKKVADYEKPAGTTSPSKTI